MTELKTWGTMRKATFDWMRQVISTTYTTMYIILIALPTHCLVQKMLTTTKQLKPRAELLRLMFCLWDFRDPKMRWECCFFFRKTKHGCLNIVLMAVCNTLGESFNKWFIKKFQIKRSIKKTLIIFILLCSSLYWVCQKNDNLQYTYHFPYLKTAWYGVMYNIYNS